MSDDSKCFKVCNVMYSTSYDPRRLYCKKGCMSDFESIEECKTNSCEKLCVKNEIGEDGHKWGSNIYLFRMVEILF